ncbi:ABC transporter ATP-binding protein [Neobacillus sp. PS3-12]|uniref:ABC transporter ATP-binding protein n=1 Tax=Neobacillus sp. PS3-12 TaxID=3070677 RepID=UPI0035A8961B
MRLLSYTKQHKKSLIFAFSLLLFTTVADVVGPIFVKVFIDDYLTPKKMIVKSLVLLGSSYIGLQVLKEILLYFQLVKFQEVALKIIQRLRIDVFSRVETLGLKYFDKTPSGSIVSRVTNDTEAIKDMFVSVLATFIQSGVFLIGILIAMFTLNVTLALFCAVLIPLVLVVIVLYRKYSSKFYQDMRERLGQLNVKLSESLQGMAIVQVFRQEKRMRREFAEINDKHFQACMKNIKIDSLLLRPAIDLVYTLGLIMVLGYFGFTSFTHSIEVGVLYAFVNYLDRFFEPVNQAMQRLSLYQQAIVAGSRVFKLLDEQELAPKQDEKSKKEILEGKIEFKGVSFSYDGMQDVLKGISFTVNPGETVAFVGHTGSGKSTIINLLLRFYEFDRGEILIDGESIRNYSTPELRANLGLVLQDPFLFYGTVKDNIRLHNSTLTDEELKEAAGFVQAHSFIEKLDKGYEHKVVERGAAFSSGQRQLLAFARTIATNPKILVLDEATANIDTETEEKIQSALSRMRKGRTTIVIAHRLSTIQDANLILVLHQGRIVEQGTHQELLALRGLYHKMYLLQKREQGIGF